MNREQARQEIRARWREFGEPDKSGKGIICPLCGNGSGRDGDGITENPRKRGQLKCWKCGFTGDAIDLYRHEYRVDYNEALHAAADFLGITIDPYRASAADDFRNTADSDRAQGPQGDANSADRETPTNGQKSPQGKTGTATGGQIADYTDYYMECMQRLDDPAALSYLQARGISQRTAQAHNLGFDPQWISPEAVRRQREKGNNWTPTPTARLIMPVSKNHYVARAISPNTARKYQKMNETGGGAVGIFNISAIQGGETVFIVEGIIDALSIIECGAAAIALNSTSNAEQLIRTIEQQKTDCSFVICPDNDEAGRRAAGVIQKGLQGLNLNNIVANISGDYNDPNDALTGNRQELEQAIAEATARAANADYLTAFFEKISGEAYRPYTTDLPFFDNLLSGGPVRQTVLLLLAAPAAGKTTLCQQIAESMARHGKPVLYLNLEMSREQMIAKSISARCTFKGRPMTILDVMQGYKWTPEQREAVKDALQEYRERVAPYLNYNPEGITGDFDTIQKYLHRTGEAARERGEAAPVIILDYLHLVSCHGLDVQETIKQTMDMLKQYAMKYDSFAVAISATNRESNKTGRITMESGRDSSGIEYGGDYVLSLNYYQIDRGDVKPSNTEKVAILQARAWRQMIIRVLKGRLCIPGWSARVYFHAAGNMFYAEDAFLPDNADIIEFGQRDDALEAADGPQTISTAAGAGKGKQAITASF